MRIKNCYIKPLIKFFVVISAIECLYLFAVPWLLNINKDFVINLLAKDSENVQISVVNPVFKTCFKPKLILKIDNLNIKDKTSGEIFLNADNADVTINLIPLIYKKFNAEYLYADNLGLNLKKYKDGAFNFEKLFPSKQKNQFKPDFKNLILHIKNYQAAAYDEELNQNLKINGDFLYIGNKKNELTFKMSGQIDSSGSLSDFDIDLKTKLPFSVERLSSAPPDSKCFIYNVNLAPFLPFVNKYIDKDISKLDGIIEFLFLSSQKDKNGIEHLTLNTGFNDFLFNKSDWKNGINAAGKNKFNADIEVLNNTINIKSLNYKAENVNIKGSGSAMIEDDIPLLDINAEVINSRAENIAAILPPNLIPKYKTMEKVKNYGIFGDIEAKVKIKGKIPQPDVTGYIKGKNIKILEKSLHPLHNGIVDINFDGRILNMKILIDMFERQKAEIEGYVYMYRDGINNVKIKTTDNIDFPLASRLAAPISKVFNFQLGPVPDMNITSGKGEIDVNIRGSVDFVNIDGFSTFDKARLTYNGLYGEILNGKGRLDFKNDIISFKSERAFVKDNPLKIEGNVRINKDLDFNISSNRAEAKDLLDIINNSTLLKDVKDALGIITEARGITKLFVNIKAKIVPVPFGQPPLPPEEAFEDMKVNGSLYLLGNSCNIEGFKIPIEHLKGIADFTETEVNIRDIDGVSGQSNIVIGGKIINDLETKIPDVDITVKSGNVNLKDTIKFLAESYLYPKNYPDISALYNIDLKHDLYFKYKAKSVDFETDKAYAVMNFINDDKESFLKAETGRIILDKSKVKLENITAGLFNSRLKIDGNVEKIDTVNPIYNLTVKLNDFSLKNLNNADKINIMPENLKNIFSQFNNYDGSADINIEIKRNILSGVINFLKPDFTYIKGNIPFNFDDFDIKINNDKIIADNIPAYIASVPFFGNAAIKNIFKEPEIKGFFTSKITDNFIKNHLPPEISDRISIEGDINFSADISGNKNNFTIEPELIFHPDANAIIDGVSLGEINDKRKFSGKINISNGKIIVKNIDYVKYVSSQNNITYPILFAVFSGIVNTADNKIEIRELNFKTHKSLSAKILNIFLKKPVLKQGTFNCDLKYKSDFPHKTAKLYGNMDCRNLDIPLFDTVLKNIRLKAEEDNININLFGFLNDSAVKSEAVLHNNLYSAPLIHSLKISADRIDNDGLLKTMSELNLAMCTNNEIKNVDLSKISIEQGFLEIKKLTVKSLTAENFKTDFSIDSNNIFRADELNVSVGEGNITGSLSYGLADNSMEGNFELNNVDSNYVAETLFDGKNQIFGNANGKILIKTKGTDNEEMIKNLSGFVYFDISDGKMPKLGSLEYLLRASNIIKSGITGLTINSILELLNLVKTGYFSNINGSCAIENGIAENIEIYSKGENLSLYMHGSYDISKTSADMEILGKLSKKISTIFGAIGNTSLNTFFKLIPGISMLDFGRKDFVEDVEKIPSFTNGDYDARIFQAIINGNINDSGYVQSFKWVK